MNDQMGQVLDCLRRTALACREGLTDGQLLERFVELREAAAFEALLRRHGPMVLGVCRRVAGDGHTAEDCFQTTFLVLARKAGSIRQAESLGNWLYGVAYRTAREARSAAARRRQKEGQAARPEAVEQSPDSGWREVLDQELRRLPEYYRAGLVLCDLEGLSRQEAARQLGWPEGTLSGRLTRARRLLRKRLARCGFTLSGGLLLAGLANEASASLPERLVGRLLEAASAATRSVPGAGSLAGVLRAVLLARTRVATVLLLVAGLAALGGGALLRPPTNATEPVALRGDPPLPPSRSAGPRRDRYGDALPEGAVARLGTARHRAANAHVAVTADGRTVVTAGNDLVIRTFDSATGETKETVRVDAPPTSETALAPDGRHLAGITQEPNGTNQLTVWALPKGDRVGRLDLGREPTQAVSVSSKGPRVAWIQGYESVPPSPQKLLLQDVGTGKPPRLLYTFTRKDPNRYGPPRTCFSPDGTRLLAHLPDGQFGCWDTVSGRLLWERNLRHLKFFFFHPDGRHVVVSPQGIGYEVWTVAEGKNLPEKEWKANGKSYADSLWPVGMSPNGKFVAFFQGERRVVLGDVERKTLAVTLDDPQRIPDEPVVGFWDVPTNFAFTPDGTGFVWRSSTVQRWATATGKPSWPATWDQGHTERIDNLRFTPDGTSLVSAGQDRAVHVWDLETHRPRLRLPKQLGALFAVTPDSKTVFISTGGRQPPLRGWDLATGKERLVLQDKEDSPQYGSSGDHLAVVRRDGRQLITVTDNHIGNVNIPPGRYITRWDLTSGGMLGRNRIGERVETSALDPDGEVVAQFDVNRPELGVTILSAADGKELGRLPNPLTVRRDATSVRCDLAVSRHGRFVATRYAVGDRRGGREPNDYRDLVIWDRLSGKPLAELPVKGPALFAFTADNRALVAATTDALEVYELASRKLAHAIRVPRAAPPSRPAACASALTVSPSGLVVATGHTDGTILLWDLAPAGRPGLLRDGLDQAWATLASADPTKAWGAVWQLQDAPELAVEALRARMKPAASAAEAAALVKLLDAEDFATREKAAERLRGLGSKAEPALRRALEGTLSLEMRLRVRRLLEPFDLARPVDENDLRDVRAVQVLELIGNPSARRLLKELAGGEKGVRLTRYASEALARLEGK
jgi:RNA polymerase sigma factor (sigma-70 family)